jgi:hypothetical protein
MTVSCQCFCHSNTPSLSTRSVQLPFTNYFFFFFAADFAFGFEVFLAGVAFSFFFTSFFSTTFSSFTYRSASHATFMEVISSPANAFFESLLTFLESTPALFESSRVLFEFTLAFFESTRGFFESLPVVLDSPLLFLIARLTGYIFGKDKRKSCVFG